MIQFPSWLSGDFLGASCGLLVGISKGKGIDSWKKNTCLKQLGFDNKKI